MARRALVLLLLAACSGTGDDGDYPLGVGVGGGGPTDPGTVGGGGGDGGVDAPLGTLSGRVCLLAEMRRLAREVPADCRSLPSGLKVKLGDSTEVEPDADGTFEVPDQAGANLLWTVSGVNIVTSLVPKSEKLLPVMGAVDYQELVDPVAMPAANQGAIVARVLKNSVPLAGATAAVANGESQRTFYDTANPQVWGETGTGELGVAWLPDNDAGAGRKLRVTNGASTSSATLDVTIRAGSITFVTVAMP